ncbi:MAG: alpha/beta fold hydrolase, partial [Pseudomonadota bacterium]
MTFDLRELAASAPVDISSSQDWREPARSAVREYAVSIPDGWIGTAGAALPPGTTVRLRLQGARADAPLVGVLGGISANRCVADDDHSRGWWRALVSPGGAVDLDAVQCASIDFVARDDAPIALTPRDQAWFFARALDEAGIERLDGFIGASFGGMVALAFAAQFPERVG